MPPPFTLVEKRCVIRLLWVKWCPGYKTPNNNPAPGDCVYNCSFNPTINTQKEIIFLWGSVGLFAGLAALSIICVIAADRIWITLFFHFYSVFAEVSHKTHAMWYNLGRRYIYCTLVHQWFVVNSYQYNSNGIIIKWCACLYNLWGDIFKSFKSFHQRNCNYQVFIGPLVNSIWYNLLAGFFLNSIYLKTCSDIEVVFSKSLNQTFDAAI